MGKTAEGEREGYVGTGIWTGSKINDPRNWIQSSFSVMLSHACARQNYGCDRMIASVRVCHFNIIKYSSNATIWGGGEEIGEGGGEIGEGGWWQYLALNYFSSHNLKKK